jgi:hypothetical protein
MTGPQTSGGGLLKVGASILRAGLVKLATLLLPVIPPAPNLTDELVLVARLKAARMLMQLAVRLRDATG